MSEVHFQAHRASELEIEHALGRYEKRFGAPRVSYKIVWENGDKRIEVNVKAEEPEWTLYETWWRAGANLGTSEERARVPRRCVAGAREDRGLQLVRSLRPVDPGPGALT